MELPLPAVFSSLVGSTGGLIFHVQAVPANLAKQVLTIQHMKWLLMTCLTVTHREQTVQFCKTASEGLHQRDDYKEFLQMTLIFFGSGKGARVSFRPPGASHHALWMAKVIYNIKIFMFHQQFSLTAKENQSVKEMVLFVSRSKFGSGTKNLWLTEHHSMIHTII